MIAQNDSVKYFRPVGWENHQDFRRKRPPWIKVKTDLLDKPKYADLTEAQRSVLLGIWVLTARIGGSIPWDTKWIGMSIKSDTRVVTKAIPKLLSLDFIELCAKDWKAYAMGVRKTRAPETETETETDSPPVGPPLSNGEDKHDDGARGTRLAPDWVLPESYIEFARNEGLPPARIGPTGDTFRDYWIAQPGRRGVKRDWFATWRNWVRRDLASGASRHGSGRREQKSGGVVAVLRELQDEGSGEMGAESRRQHGERSW